MSQPLTGRGSSLRYPLLLPPLLFAGPFLLALGLVLPLVRFEKLYFFEETPSLADIIATLWRDGNIALSLLVALFSAIFPVLKILTVLYEAARRGNEPGRSGLIGRFIPLLSKWSMMDVLLVALVIVAAKSSGVASAFTQPGLWCYAGSALTVTVAHWLIQARPSPNGL
ncbi:paraquat-inducible protein A [Hoeflea prorocentri]|uniref:Paraquat-inducible protein A n=1 Tax=Hoeflea prorocentri TaxID=1922333 RepID=A0A9X3UIP1_9HYPH|nr:paraquat-inducible protein A [Hoeflea prorocentri]MCY6379340.1 paraquat-inducible protein A [Hoeflea prorocentri]MDA5397141.1 paraquat-inducible protein A [Hoeflea prorocentri]